MFTAEQLIEPVNRTNAIRQHHEPGCKMLKGILTREEAKKMFEETGEIYDVSRLVTRGYLRVFDVVVFTDNYHLDQPHLKAKGFGAGITGRIHNQSFEEHFTTQYPRDVLVIETMDDLLKFLNNPENHNASILV